MENTIAEVTQLRSPSGGVGSGFPLTVYKASAGSGKTFTLASEFIKLLVRNPQNYRQILAVTFTNKATEEMKMRILSQLYGIWRGLDDSKSYAQKVYAALGGELSQQQIAQRAGEALHLLLHNYSHFRVETIDSFFQSVMRNLARELNLTANLRVGLNDVQVEELAVDQLIDSLSASDQMLQWLLKYIMDNINDDRSWNVIGQIKVFGRTIFRDYYKSHSEQLNAVMHQKGFFEGYQQQLHQLRQQARRRMEDIGNAFFETLESEGLDIDDLSHGVKGVAGLFLKLQRGEFDEAVLGKRASDCLGQPDKWCRKTHPRRDLIHHLADTSLGNLLRQAFDEQPRQWKLYKSADLTLRHLSQLRLLASIEQKVHQLNEEQNRFLLSNTQQLLHQLIDGSDSPFIFEKIGTQLEHIMIDEFQDTSTVQWQNFKVLLQETMSHKGSENLIVGDVKQSIYRWRSGDWRLLAGIKAQFSNAHEMVDVKPLGVNWRSARRIINFNNAFFTEAAKHEGVTAYDDVEQLVPDNRPDEGQVEVRLLPTDDYERQTLQLLAGQVLTLLDEGVSPSDIAILVRANRNIPIIAQHINATIPQLKVVSDEAFRLDASTAVVTIVQALRYLTHPDDHIALAFLQQQCQGQLPPAFTPTLLQMPLHEMAERIYALFQLDQKEQQSAYLCAFYDQMTDFVADNGSDVEAFLRLWDEELFKKTIQSPMMDGLRLISIHKSKGLEFPCVLVPFCDWPLELPDVLWCSPTEAPFNQLPIVPIDFSQKGMKGTIFERDYNEEHQQNLVDNMNLLYVAFTRAAERLFVYGKRKSGQQSRSALIEQVLPQIEPQLPGATLSGNDDESHSIVFSYGSPVASKAAKRPQMRKQANPFLQESLPIKVDIGVFTSKVDFRQSNKSRQFCLPDADDANDESQRRTTYIQTGSLLHNVLSHIDSTDDVDDVLRQMEQDGMLSNSNEANEDSTSLPSRHELLQLLRQRLASRRVAEWFQPGRWQLFNECTILTLDSETGRVAERRPDSVMTDGHETIVVDFKFGRERAEYHEQVRQYMQLLNQMGHHNVKGFLWLVYDNKVIDVKTHTP